MLPRTLPALLAAAAGDRAEIIYVCNGCTDGSAAIIRSLGGDAVRVVEIAQASKTGALNVGDAQVTAFPRFYVDADALLGPGDFGRLTRVLADGEFDLVSPSLDFDLSGTTRVSRMMAETWLALPHARSGAFQTVIGLSRRSRERWGRFPDVLGDDVFIAAMTPPERRRRVAEVTAIAVPPPCFWSWVRVRARWLDGERALARMGFPCPRPKGQRAALLQRLMMPGTTLGATLFVAGRMLGDLFSCLPRRHQNSWHPERAATRR